MQKIDYEKIGQAKRHWERIMQEYVSFTREIDPLPFENKKIKIIVDVLDENISEMNYQLLKLIMED